MKRKFSFRKTCLSRFETTLLVLLLGLASCSKTDLNTSPTDVESVEYSARVFTADNLEDTYGQIAPFEFHQSWGPYNVHDPSILKVGEWYYCYTTDASYGQSVKPGIQVRKSQDLVTWTFVGWVLDGLPEQGVEYVRSHGAKPNQSLWAPYIMKVGDEYRLYYSLASDGFRVSAIGLLTSINPEGPWTEKGLAVTSVTAGPGTNAIDPSVVVTPGGEHYMYYGSAWDGLFVVRLNPQTGLTATAGDRGTLIVRRGMTNGLYNGNLEAPEIIYNAEQGKYYLFVSYDWIDTKYNVRVFRSDSPTGPFLDWDGIPATTFADNNAPMILAPYAFDGHAGWQGVAHCAVFKDDGDQYYMATQGRPAVDKFFMVMHVRKIEWTPEGWPLVLPERYANVPQTDITSDDIAGVYDQIVQGYATVPGYANEQLDPNINYSFTSELSADGTINGDVNNTWSYQAPWLELRWGGGVFVDRLYVARERDWENKISSTIVMSGFNGGGLSIWLKKRQ